MTTPGGHNPASISSRPGDRQRHADFEAAHPRHDLDAFRSFVHDDALIESIAGGGVRRTDETVDALRAAFAAGVDSKGTWELEEIAEEVVLATAAIRYMAGKGVRDRVIYWLITGQDGLVWRIRIFHTRKEALAHFGEHGQTLGLWGPSAGEPSNEG